LQVEYHTVAGSAHVFAHIILLSRYLLSIVFLKPWLMQCSNSQGLRMSPAMQRRVNLCGLLPMSV
jgi:hypothetical protein